MITKLLSTDQKRLGTEEGSREDLWISLGRENRIDFMVDWGVKGDVV